VTNADATTTDGAIISTNEGSNGDPKHVLFQGEQSEDGYWRNEEGEALSISASDLERHGYCPMSWQLSRLGVKGVGEAIEEGIKAHDEIHKVVEEYEANRQDAQKEVMIWSWWYGIVVVFIIDAIIFINIEGKLPPFIIAKYLVILGIVWLFVGLLMTTIPWRSWIGISEPRSKPPKEILIFNHELVEPVFQKPGFIGGWAEGGRTEAAFFLGSILTTAHGIALGRADDRIQAGYILLMVALIWTFIASWRLQRVLISLNQAEQTRQQTGFADKAEIAYSDDSKTAGLLEDLTIGLRGRPDQIVVIDGEFIPVEQKTGRVPKEPHFSHIMQLLAYLHLVGNSTGNVPPFGILRYGEESIFQIEWDEVNKLQLQNSVKEIQRLMVEGGAKRNHERSGKCNFCSRRYACSESLV